MRMQEQRECGRGPAGRRRRRPGVRRRSRALAWVPLVLLASGCATLFEAPDVRLVSVRLLGIGLGGGTLEAGVLVSNPNRYALRGGQLSYDLELGADGAGGETRWLPLAGGQLEREIEVPGRDSAVVAVPIEFAWDAVGGAMRSLLERGTFDYRITGSLQLLSPIRRAVPYRRTGTLSLGR